MIWYILLQGLNEMVTVLSNMIPDFATVTQLPYGLDTMVGDAFGFIYAFGSLFPPIVTIVHVIMAYMAYAIVRLALQFWLGHRMPK